MVSSFIRWYSLRLETHPYMIKGITSGMIAATGDFTCQYFMSSLSKSNSVVAAVVDDDDETSGDGGMLVNDAITSNHSHVHHNNNNNNNNSSSSSSSKNDTKQVVPEQPPLPSTTTTTTTTTTFLAWWDSLRTIRFGLLGAFYVAPGCHLWYNQLAIWFPIAQHRRSVLIPVLLRVILDQFVFTPVFLIGWLLSLSQLESFMITKQDHHIANRKQTNCNETNTTNAGTDDVISDCDATMSHDTITTITRICTNHHLYQTIIVEHQLVQILYSNWMLWIPVQLCNFYHVPTKYQVLTSNCVAFVWNMYLSFMTSSSSSNATARTHSDTGLSIMAHPPDR